MENIQKERGRDGLRPTPPAGRQEGELQKEQRKEPKAQMRAARPPSRSAQHGWRCAVAVGSCEALIEIIYLHIYILILYHVPFDMI